MLGREHLHPCLSNDRIPIANQHLYLLFGPTPLPRYFAYHGHNPSTPLWIFLLRIIIGYLENIDPNTPNKLAQRICARELPVQNRLHFQTLHHDIATIEIAVYQHEWFIGSYETCRQLFPFLSQLVYEILQRCVLEKVEINVGCRGMGVVINFFIVASENVVLGTLVRAYIIAFLRMKFGLSVEISR